MRLFSVALFTDHFFVGLFLLLAALSARNVMEFREPLFLLVLAAESFLLSLLSRSPRLKAFFSSVMIFFLFLFVFSRHTGFRLRSPFFLSAYFIEKMDYFKNMEVYGFVKALATGNRSALSAPLKALFSRTGSYHLIAISGLHFGIAASLLIGLLCRIRKRTRIIILFLLLTLYLLLTDFYVSALRAYLMIAYGLVSAYMNFRIEPLNAWALATSLILFFQPFAFFSVGFWMSVLATFGILVVLPALSLIKGFALKIMTISLMAQLPLIPILGMYFGRLNLASPLMSLLALIFIYPLVAIGFMLLFPLPHFLAKAFVFAEEHLAAWFLHFLSLFDNEGNCLSFSFTRQHAFLYWGIYILGILILIWIYHRKGQRKQKIKGGHCVR
ncbi:MAG TPA: ComEC/Rec2 family competence protein [Firmicutes bacterium]|nr:ComEC/Rec2 family competence protein [Bacillota bacterium]